MPRLSAEPYRHPVATLAGERMGACLTAEREVLVEIDGPLPRVDVEALAAFLAMVLPTMEKR